MSTLAVYHGTCTECFEAIIPGQRITTTDGDDTWVHQHCHAMPEAAPCTCEKCWLVHAGECL